MDSDLVSINLSRADLLVLLDAAEHYCDEGVGDEGWRSKELTNAASNLRAEMELHDILWWRKAGIRLTPPHYG